MISSSISGITTKNDVIVHANVSDSAIVAATTKKIRNSYGSFSLANKKLLAVTVPGAGLFLAQSQELIESHGIHWHVVVVEQVACDIGYYQFDDGAGGVCKICPDGKQCLGGAWLPLPKKGYFSPLSDINDKATECFAPENCPGGDTNGGRACFESESGLELCLNKSKTDEYGSDYICRTGSSGRLCDICEDSYFDSTGDGCVHCSDNIVPAIIVGVLLTVFAVAGIYIWQFYGEYIRANFSLVVGSFFDTGRMKVTLINLQIIGSISWSTGVLWPAPFKYAAKLFTIALLDVYDFLPINCVGAINWYSWAAIQSLVPLAVILVLFIVCSALERNGHDFISWSTLILYILLPSVNLTLVRVIKCMDMPDGTSWVAADLSLQCTDENGTMLTDHALMMAFSWVMMLFWGPVGVPLIFHKLLASRKKEIKKYDKEDTMPENLKPLSFLFFCYKPENYNAETWECLRRLVLMGGVALLAKPGDDDGQGALFGMLLGICFAIWERERLPWANPGANALAISFSWVIFFSFMGAFVVVTSEDVHHGISSPKAVSWVLILMSFAVLVMAIYQQTKDFNLNRELLGLKNEVADFRRQAIGIVFARRTMRAFERFRFLGGDWAMQPNDMPEGMKERMTEDAGMNLSHIRSKEEADNAHEMQQRFMRLGKKTDWFWQEEAHNRHKWADDVIHPDPQLLADKRKIWVQYSKAVAMQLEKRFVMLQGPAEGEEMNPLISVDLEERVIGIDDQTYSGNNGLRYRVDCKRMVQINANTQRERPVLRVITDLEDVITPDEVVVDTSGRPDLNLNINTFTNRDGRGTTVTFDAEQMDARIIDDDDIPHFPFDLIVAGEQMLLIQKGQLIQVQKRRDDGWSYGYVVWEPKELSEAKKDDRVTKRADFWDTHKFGDGGGDPEIEMKQLGQLTGSNEADTFRNENDREEDLGGESSGWFPSVFVRPPQMQELKKLQDALGGREEVIDALAVPAYWSQASKNGETTNYKFITLNQNKGEFKEVEKAFLTTMQRGRNIKIKAIDRIENLGLWQSYAAKKSSMLLRAKNENTDSTDYEKRYMFHGTDPAVLTKISQQGFNRAYCGKNAVLYGKGVYFALTSAYSNNYTSFVSGKTKRMFVCRVLKGETSQGHNEQLVPEIRVEATNTLYDSTTDAYDECEPGQNGTSPDTHATGQRNGADGCNGVRNMYVVYHDAQAYPEYMVEYEDRG
jgi:poly [ADP-ribose] polymerase 10/14/15